MPNTKLYKELQILWNNLLKEIKNTHHDLKITLAPKIINNSDLSLQIPLTIMFYEDQYQELILKHLKKSWPTSKKNN